MRTLTVDGVIVATHALLTFEQEYEALAGQTFKRTADGSGTLRALWSGKLRTTLSGTGWAPSGLVGLAAGSAHALGCIAPVSVDAAGVFVALPTARRSDADHDPVAFALIGDGLVPTAIVEILDDVAELVPVAGAVGYRVHYWPSLSVVITSNTAKGDNAAAFGWQIVAEEL